MSSKRPSSEGGKFGCFADANCALAYLLEHKRRGWEGRAATLRRLAGEDLQPATRPWSLYEKGRVVGPPSMQQTAEEYIAERQRDAVAAAVASVSGKKRKSSTSDATGPESPPPAPPPPPLPESSPPEPSAYLEYLAELQRDYVPPLPPTPPKPPAPPPTEPAKTVEKDSDESRRVYRYRVEYIDENGAKRLFFTDDWRATLEGYLRCSLRHPMPCFALANGNLTIFPSGEVDAMHLSTLGCKANIINISNHQ